MTDKEKELLLKDLSGRLPYGVKVCARFNTGNRYTTNVTAISADRDYIQIRQSVLHTYTSSSVEDIRPYLRPMSSMTDDEKLKYITLTHYNTDDEGKPYRELTLDALDWLNEHHFDYRGLIPMGLALEAPEDMYKTE